MSISLGQRPLFGGAPVDSGLAAWRAGWYLAGFRAVVLGCYGVLAWCWGWYWLGIKAVGKT